MLTLFQALMSFIPYAYEIRETRYFNMLKDYDLLRKFMKNTCNSECILDNEQEFLENCPALKNLDPVEFPEYEPVGYKFYSGYDYVSCKLWTGYNETRHDIYISEFYFKDIIISVSTRMSVNYEKLMDQYCSFKDHYYWYENGEKVCYNNEIHESWNIIAFENNEDLINKVDKIIEHTCDFNCSATLDYSVLVNGEPTYTVADSCRIKNIEIEKGIFYDMYIQYDQGMCEIFKDLHKYATDPPVYYPTDPSVYYPTEDINTASNNNDLYVGIMIAVIVIIIIVLIICITICCVKNSMWYVRKQIEENVSA